MKIPLAASDFRRGVSRTPDVLLRNRFVEPNPVLSDGKEAYIARPGLRYWQTVGDGPIRATFSQPGAFDDDLFVVSFNSLYRVARADGTPTLIFSGLSGAAARTTVRMAATGDIGIITPRLWIADGAALYCYTEDGFAGGTLTAAALPADGDVVVLGTMYYRLSSGTLDAGAPAGTAGNPWRVLIAGTVTATLLNLLNAINASGVAGTDYSTALVENNLAYATSSSAATVEVRAFAEGAAGNTVATTETGADLSWGGATLAGGGATSIFSVPTPDNVGVIDVAVINSFVIVIPAQGAGINGRFYWIQPGAVVIDPLDFATAERSADPIYQCVVFNDQFWLPGQNTTEVWFMSGDPDAPVQRLQGVVFDRGTISGTAIQIKDFMVVIDNDGGVFKIQGGETRISTPDIAERLREAVNTQNINLP